MLTTVLFDMGGTLEDIWHNEGTKRERYNACGIRCGPMG